MVDNRGLKQAIDDALTMALATSNNNNDNNTNSRTRRRSNKFRISAQNAKSLVTSSFVKFKQRGGSSTKESGGDNNIHEKKIIKHSEDCKQDSRGSKNKKGGKNNNLTAADKKHSKNIVRRGTTDSVISENSSAPSIDSFERQLAAAAHEEDSSAPSIDSNEKWENIRKQRAAMRRQSSSITARVDNTSNNDIDSSCDEENEGVDDVDDEHRRKQQKQPQHKPTRRTYDSGDYSEASTMNSFGVSRLEKDLLLGTTDGTPPTEEDGTLTVNDDSPPLVEVDLNDVQQQHDNNKQPQRRLPNRRAQMKRWSSMKSTSSMLSLTSETEIIPEDQPHKLVPDREVHRLESMRTLGSLTLGSLEDSTITDDNDSSLSLPPTGSESNDAQYDQNQLPQSHKMKRWSSKSDTAFNESSASQAFTQHDNIRYSFANASMQSIQSMASETETEAEAETESETKAPQQQCKGPWNRRSTLESTASGAFTEHNNVKYAELSMTSIGTETVATEIEESAQQQNQRKKHPHHLQRQRRATVGSTASDVLNEHNNISFSEISSSSITTADNESIQSLQRRRATVERTTAGGFNRLSISSLAVQNNLLEQQKVLGSSTGDKTQFKNMRASTGEHTFLSDESVASLEEEYEAVKGGLVSSKPKQTSSDNIDIVAKKEQEKIDRRRRLSEDAEPSMILEVPSGIEFNERMRQLSDLTVSRDFDSSGSFFTASEDSKSSSISMKQRTR